LIQILPYPLSNKLLIAFLVWKFSYIVCLLVYHLNIPEMSVWWCGPSIFLTAQCAKDCEHYNHACEYGGPHLCTCTGTPYFNVCTVFSGLCLFNFHCWRIKPNNQTCNQDFGFIIFFTVKATILDIHGSLYCQVIY